MRHLKYILEVYINSQKYILILSCAVSQVFGNTNVKGMFNEERKDGKA